MASAASRPQLPPTPRADDWAYFKRQFANYLLIAEAKDSHRTPLLLNALGRDGLDIYDGLPDNKETYTDIVAWFDEYFSGKASILLRRKYFFEARQIRTESVTEFACRLRRLIKECDFMAAIGATLLRDIFVVGIYSNILGERLLAEDASTLTFDKAINMAEAFERARSERQTVEQCAIVSAVRDDTAGFRRVEERRCYNCKATGHVRNACPLTASREASKQLLPKVSPAGAACLRRCYRCSSTEHLASSPTCPARNATCKSCGTVGHYQKACRKTRKEVGAIAASTQKLVNNECVDDYFAFRVATVCRVRNSSMARVIRINDCVVSVLPDTGAEVNLLPRDACPHQQLEATDINLKAWGNFKLAVLGKFTGSVVYADYRVVADFYVVDKKSVEVQGLISYDLCQRLGIMAELALQSKPVSEAKLVGNAKPSDARSARHKERSRSRSPVRRSKVKTKRVVIANVPYDVNWKKIKELFRKKIGYTGYIEMFEQNGKPSGMGVMEFKTYEGAGKAIDIMHRHPLGDRKLVVREETLKDRERIKQYNSGIETAQQAAMNLITPQVLAQLRIESSVCNQIYITNLNVSVTLQKLKDVFMLAGRVMNVELKRNRDGSAKGHAVIKFEHPFEAVQAISMFNNQVLFDRLMHIKMDKEMTSQVSGRSQALTPRLPKGLQGMGIGLGMQGQAVRSLHEIAHYGNNMGSTNMQSGMRGSLISKKMPMDSLIMGGGGMGHRSFDILGLEAEV